jgi:hypothetical protein
MSAWIVEIDIEVLNTYTFEPKAGVLPGGGVVPPPPLGRVHCWLEVSAHAQICTWVPEPP